MLWGRGRPACVFGGRCFRHDTRVCAPAGGRAQCLRHGPGGPERDPRTGGGNQARARSARRHRSHAGPTRHHRAHRAGAPAGGRGHCGGAPPRACALRGQRLGTHRAVWVAGRNHRRVRERLPPAFCLSHAGQGLGGGGRVRRGRGVRRCTRGAAPRAAARARSAAPQHRAHVHRRGGWRCSMARRRPGGARGPAPRRCDSRPGHHCREERHHHRGARLGGRADRPGPR